MFSQGDPVEVEIFFPRCTKKSERTHFPSVQMVVEITHSLSPATQRDQDVYLDRKK